jgi:hypothetical protein
MDIVVINSTFVKNEEPKKPATRIPGKKSKFMEKRRNRTDRRKSVRDGVVVRLSYQNDRRTGTDRRRTQND